MKCNIAYLYISQGKPSNSFFCSYAQKKYFSNEEKKFSALEK